MPKRPYRLWDSQQQTDLRGRNFKHERNAMNGALIEAKWQRPGAMITVYEVATSRVLGVYKRHPAYISFTR